MWNEIRGVLEIKKLEQRRVFQEKSVHGCMYFSLHSRPDRILFGQVAGHKQSQDVLRMAFCTLISEPFYAGYTDGYAFISVYIFILQFLDSGLCPRL